VGCKTTGAGTNYILDAAILDILDILDIFLKGVSRVDEN